MNDNYSFKCSRCHNVKVIKLPKTITSLALWCRVCRRYTVHKIQDRDIAIVYGICENCNKVFPIRNTCECRKNAKK